MATTAPFAARLAEVYISNAASADYTSATYVAIERSKGGSFKGKQERANASSNDSGGDHEYVSTFRDVDTSFTFVAVPSGAAGQEHLWTAWKNSEVRALKFEHSGAVSGDSRVRMLVQITNIEKVADLGDVGLYRCDFARTGGLTRDTSAGS